MVKVFVFLLRIFFCLLKAGWAQGAIKLGSELVTWEMIVVHCLHWRGGEDGEKLGAFAKHSQR